MIIFLGKPEYDHSKISRLTIRFLYILELGLVIKTRVSGLNPIYLGLGVELNIQVHPVDNPSEMKNFCGHCPRVSAFGHVWFNENHAVIDLHESYSLKGRGIF